MKDYFVPANPEAKTPMIDFKVTGELKIEGFSVPENPVLFYEPAIEWLNQIKSLKLQSVSLSMNLEYFNTSSSKIFYNMFKMLEKYQTEGLKVNIIWCYDKTDEDMHQTGKDYSSIVKAPFELKGI